MEWIMIKVRVGQETFCKWGAAASIFLWVCDYRPLTPLRAELLSL